MNYKIVCWKAPQLHQTIVHNLQQILHWSNHFANDLDNLFKNQIFMNVLYSLKRVLPIDQNTIL